MVTTLRIHKVEPDSFRHRILARPSSYVPPILWKPEILDDIDCDVLPNISKDKSNYTTNPTTKDSHVGYTPTPLSILARNCRRDETSRQLFGSTIHSYRSVLKSSGYSTPHLYLDGKSVAPTTPHYLYRSTTTSRPILAYVDKNWLWSKRNHFNCRRRLSSVALKIAHGISESMTKLDFDPYIACLLISMAQDSCSFTSDDEIPVHVFSPSTDKKSFTQHSSNISRQYLQKWEKSYEFSSCRLTITRKTLTLNQLYIFLEEFREKEKSNACSSEALVSSKKRKVKSDMTDGADKSSTVKRVRH
ncbi:hypothetical protein OCU04_009417 [Sclerotinia nivalis]|uniref:Uncharacterized protein n=1 Tax=Sclerotinia nivalis TaxID=352851 RepID=A0A9X0AEZ5_9HELO|nr:hypothetical protein OCU04_009417 [Sclerotinia nivalis]